VKSQIMTDKITALRRNRLREIVGRLEADQIDRLDRALLIVLGLAK
jgi:mRNA interferase MazF